ncbi:MAG: CocE/NonD family hydrolase [Chlamydiales bacterium]
MRLLRYCFLFVICSFVLIAEEQQPAYTLYIPMRDGVALPTDIYLPSGKETGLPCVLVRTPAGRTRYKDVFVPLTKAGYAVAIQDARSYLDPEGKTMPCVHDAWGDLKDGYDTVEWLGKSELTNGKIGTMGFSAMGIMQLLMAPAAPPSLTCQYIGVAPASMYHHAMFLGGQLLKHQVEGWLGYYAKHPSILDFVHRQREFSPFWEGLDTTKVAHLVQSPAIHYGGWFDTFCQGTIDAFVSRQENGGDGARGRQKLIMGPWGHFYPLVDKIGDFSVPETGKQPPFDFSPLRWFDHYLKGLDNGADKIPNVIYYVMGPFDGTPSKGNLWRTADKWPVPAKETSLYLTASHHLDEHTCNESATYEYAYNPENPVPTHGGRNLFLESGPKDQSDIEKREDVVIFTSEELQEDTEVTGRIKAKVWFSTDCSDTDLIVKLCDVYPDGKSFLITDGICRLGSLPDQHGEPREVEVDLWSTSIVFAKGHKIRVLVTSSDYPRFEKNLNCKKANHLEKAWQIAHNKIHIGPNTPSCVILPIVGEGICQDQVAKQ